MNSEKYIGLEVHQATISVAVMDSKGKVVMESILETKAATMRMGLAQDAPPELGTTVLRRLDNASNSEHFLALLAQKIQPEDADIFLETFRRTRKNHGTAAARAQVHRGVTAATDHAAAMASSSS